MGMISYIKEELNVIKERDPAIKTGMEVLLYSSFKAILSYRVAHKLFLNKHYFLARWVSQRAARKTGIEIHPGATIGKGLFIDHGSGVIIGETTVIGDNVTIGHQAVVHGCTVGDRTLIGMAATILDGAEIGCDCIVGAGSLVTKHTRVPDGSLVLGSPAKVVRQLTEAEKKEIYRNSREYVKVAREMQEQGLLP